MNPVSFETDHWSSTTTAPRGGMANGDLFAELLRQHNDARDPTATASRDDTRQSSGRGRHRPTIEGLDRPRNAPADRPADDMTAEDDAETARGTARAGGSDDADADAATGDRHPRTAETAARDGAAPAEPPQAETVAPAIHPDTNSPAIPERPAPVAAGLAIAAAAGTPTATAAAPQSPVSAPVDPAGPVPTAADTPATAAAATAATVPGQAHSPAAAPGFDARPSAGQPPAAQSAAVQPAAAQSAATQSAATQSAAIQAVVQDALAPAAAAAGDPAAIAADVADPLDPILSTGGGTPDEATVQVQRAPGNAPVTPPGLGKLGAGAEVALAAQVVGRPARETPTPANGSANTQIATATSQPSANQAAPQDGAAAPTAPAGAQVASQSAAMPAAQGMPAPLAAAFQATLDAASAEMPGSATGSSTTAIAGSGPHGSTASAGVAASHGKPAPAAGSPAEQLAVHVQRAVRDGNSRITVQLNPAELGHVEVRLDFARDGSVSATVLADRHDTLDMLQRDARQLERALQDAGLQTNSGSLSFDLRDGGRQGFGSQMARGDDGSARQPRSDGDDAGGSRQPALAMTGGSDSGVDIHV